MKYSIATGLMILALAGCASTSNETYDATRNWTVEKIYAQARADLDEGNYTQALKMFETLQAKFPYGQYAQQALMDQAYTYFKDREPELALSTANRFIQLYPTHPSLDYIYYLKGLIYLNEDSQLLAKLARQDLSERDQVAFKEAYGQFDELVKRFPNSKYRVEAQTQMNKLSTALGSNQLHIARYYMGRGAYLAAANRAQEVLKQYNNTGYNEEALGLLMTAYDKLGMNDLKADTRRVLELNFPKSVYLTNAWEYNKPNGWSLW